MHTDSLGQLGSNNVPAFLSKLWRLVDTSENNDLISWSLVSFFKNFNDFKNFNSLYQFDFYQKSFVTNKVLVLSFKNEDYTISFKI